MPDLQSKKEKRKSQRVDLNLTVKYKNPGSARFRKAITCENISGKGIKALLGHPLKIKGRINILLCHQDISKPISAVCRVVWCNQDGDGKFKTGLEFLEIKQKQQFIEFLCDNLLDMSLKD